MRTWKRNLGLMSLTAGLALTGLGCATHDHRSMSSYEYSEDRGQDRRDPAPVEVEHQQPDSEWHMASPGRMVVDPSRK